MYEYKLFIKNNNNFPRNIWNHIESLCYIKNITGSLTEFNPPLKKYGKYFKLIFNQC